MKNIFLFVVILIMVFSFISCSEKSPITPDVMLTAEDDAPVTPSQENIQDDVPEVVLGEDTTESENVKSYTSTVNNNLNGAEILYAGDFYIYNDFVAMPENEYTGGEYFLYRVKYDERRNDNYVPEVIYAPYFAARNMCIYGNKLYFTSGGGGGRHLLELDLNTLENKELHDNLSSEFGYFVDSLQLVGDKLYFECNGSIYRMKTDQSEFEVLLDGQNDFSSYMLGVMDKYVFYQNYNDYQLRCIDTETGADSLFKDNYIVNLVNFYDGRVYYTDDKKLISSDASGIETRTVFELEEDEVFHALNVADGYVYYVVTKASVDQMQGTEYQTIYEYNLNGGEKRKLYSGAFFYQLTVENGKLYFYEKYPDVFTSQLKCLDPKTLQAELFIPANAIP